MVTAALQRFEPLDRFSELAVWLSSGDFAPQLVIAGVASRVERCSTSQGDTQLTFALRPARTLHASRKGKFLRRAFGYGAQITAPILYLTFPGNAREALEFYASVFGGALQLHTFADFLRIDGPAESIAHGALHGGPVALFGCDASEGETTMRLEGVSLSLLGAATPEVLHSWFDRLAASGVVLDPLGPKPWGASDGQVRDRYGLCWLIGYEPTQ